MGIAFDDLKLNILATCSINCQVASEKVISFVFGFYSNKLGCLGSLMVSVILSVILIILMRSCSS